MVHGLVHPDDIAPESLPDMFLSSVKAPLRPLFWTLIRHGKFSESVGPDTVVLGLAHLADSLMWREFRALLMKYPRLPTNTYDTVAQMAACKGNLGLLRFLMPYARNRGADLVPILETALLQACCFGYLNIVQYCIAGGANLFVQKGLPFKWCLLYGQSEILRHLLDVSGLSRERARELNFDPYVREATFNDCVECTRILIRRRLLDVSFDLIIPTLTSGNMPILRVLMENATEYQKGIVFDLALHWPAHRHNILSLLQ